MMICGRSLVSRRQPSFSWSCEREWKKEGEHGYLALLSILNYASFFSFFFLCQFRIVKLICCYDLLSNLTGSLGAYENLNRNRWMDRDEIGWDNV
jgi:hypothetical protein